MLRAIKKYRQYLLSLPSAVVFLIIRVRTIRITTGGSRVGHLAPEFDILLKRRELGLISKNLKFIFIYNEDTIANKAFLYLLPDFIIRIPLRGSLITRILTFLTYNKHTTISFDDFSAMYSTCVYYTLNAIWDSRPPLFSVPAAWRGQREQLFRKLGKTPEQKYVCIHARESGYDLSGDYYHRKRNADIQSLKLTSEYLTRQGYLVIRMGDKSMTPLANWPQGVFDYATSDESCPQMDLALCADCFFFVGCASGAIHMANIFSRPVVFFGGALVFSFCSSGFSHEIGIPKLFRIKKTQELVPLADVYSSGLSEIRFSSEIDRLGMELVENSDEEIVEVVQEMVGRLNGSWRDTREDLDLQRIALSLLRPGMFCYGTSSSWGALFLRRYKYLLKYEEGVIR